MLKNCKYDKNGKRVISTYNQVTSLVGVKVRLIKGKVINWQGDVITGSIVSLFKKTKNGLDFVGSEVVGKDGKYCFKNMLNGKYILKAGFEGFNRTEVELNLDSRNRKAKTNLNVTLELGT